MIRYNTFGPFVKDMKRESQNPYPCHGACRTFLGLWRLVSGLSFRNDHLLKKVLTVH
jgi:hypothetical protein